MSGKEILLTMPPNTREVIHEHMEKRLSEAGYTFRAIYSDTPLESDALCDALANVSGYIVGHETVDAQVLETVKKLQVVSKFGVGTDNIDVAAAQARGVEVSNCPGSNSNAVAELTLGLMLSSARNTQNLCTDLRGGRWSVEIGSELAGKRIGILGFGNIGRKVARYLQPFTSDILVYDAFVDQKAAEEYGVRYTTLDEIAQTADYITVHLPLIPQTHHLFDARMFASMKPGVFIINAARGGIIDEEALFDAVQKGIVARAAVDVFETEPATSSKLLKDDRFIVLPHIGAATVEATFTMANMAMENVMAVLEGRPNPHPVRVS